MTQSQFTPYHNRHIKFKLKNGTQLSGVLFDALNEDNGDLYTFVATQNMVAWKKAEENKNKAEQEKLAGQINLQDIDSAELLNY